MHTYAFADDTTPTTAPPTANSLNLSVLKWVLYGWRPYAWKLGNSLETGQFLQAEFGPIPARVPGSVQQALFDVGLIKDWNVGTQSRDCEWVEHYHWQFHAVIPDAQFPHSSSIALNAQGLDYSGWVFVDKTEVGHFAGTFVPQRFDLSHAVKAQPEHTIDILFEEPPREQGQIGYTSRSRYFKPRFAYGWDWCPRIVPIGVWDALTIEGGPDASIMAQDVVSHLDADNKTGRVEIAIAPSTPNQGFDKVNVQLRDGNKVLASAESAVSAAQSQMNLTCSDIQPWWPNLSHGNTDGHAKLYRLEISGTDAKGNVVWESAREIGFKRVEWRQCTGAPKGALPWICVVNGEPTFLQGVNWSPVRPLYPDTTDEEYAQLVDLYAQMGCNCFRVNGVGLLEKEVFYNLCDKAGILVWQDFPMSSSGVENWPPEDPQAIKDITQIAESFIPRRHSHPSLLLWCGGNELQSGPNGEKMGGGKPAPADHPCLAALHDVVKRLDPGRRFLPTTGYGPLFYAQRENFGKGLHHLVHGPWGMGSFTGLDDWRDYWSHDDALFRAEVGMPGASPPALIRHYAGGLPNSPERMDIWKHGCAWWIQWNRFKDKLTGLSDDDALTKYCELTQTEQADALAFAATASKNRFPGCGGFIIWHGHDCFPCAINNSLIDFERKPKPVYFAMQKIFRAAPQQKQKQ